MVYWGLKSESPGLGQVYLWVTQSDPRYFPVTKTGVVMNPSEGPMLRSMCSRVSKALDVWPWVTVRAEEARGPCHSQRMETTGAHTGRQVPVVDVSHCYFPRSESLPYILWFVNEHFCVMGISRDLRYIFCCLQKVIPKK